MKRTTAFTLASRTAVLRSVAGDEEWAFGTIHTTKLFMGKSAWTSQEECVRIVQAFFSLDVFLFFVCKRLLGFAVASQTAILWSVAGEEDWAFGAST